MPSGELKIMEADDYIQVRLHPTLLACLLAPAEVEVLEAGCLSSRGCWFNGSPLGVRGI